MKKLFTTILLMGVALIGWASVTATKDGTTLIINYVADPNNPDEIANLNIGQAPGELIKEDMRNATTLRLTGDWENKHLSKISDMVGRLIKTEGAGANPDKKVFLDLSACTKMISKVVKASDGTWNADIDWVTTAHKFLPDPNNPQVDVTTYDVTKTVTPYNNTTVTATLYNSDVDIPNFKENLKLGDNADLTAKYSYTRDGSEGTIGYYKQGDTEVFHYDYGDISWTASDGDGWYWVVNAYQGAKLVTNVVIDNGETVTYTYQKNNNTIEVTEDQLDTDNDGNLIVENGYYKYTETITHDASLFKFSDGAFNNSGKLSGIAFPNHADFNYIPADLCNGLSALTNVTFGDYIEWIGERAFQDTYLAQPTFPATMKVFDGDCFKNAMANSLFTTVNLSALSKIQIVDYMAFGTEDGKVSNLATFTLPTSKNTSLKYFANYVIRGSKVEELNFTYCEGIYNFAHDGQATFGEFSPNWDSYWTFYNCPKLETIILPPNLRYVTKNAFDHCTSLQTVTFLGDAVYNKATCVEGGTNTITNPLIIDEQAFKDLGTLTTVNFCNRVTEIRKEAFQATGLTSIHIPASVQVIGVHAFQESKSLATVYFDEIDSDCAPCKHARTVIAGEHRVQAKDPVTGELLFNEDGTPVYELDANGEIKREGDGDGAFFHCPVTDVYLNAVNAEIICENKAFDYDITFGQTDPKGNFATLHYPEGEEEKYVNLQHYLDDETAHTPGLFQKWLQDHYNWATKPNNNGWHEFINSGPTPKDIDEPPFRDGEMFLRTYSDPNYARIVPKGVKAYIVRGLETDNTTGEVSLVLQNINVIPKQTGVILFGQPNANFETEKTENGETIKVSGKILSMTAVEFEPGQGIPLRRDYWDELSKTISTSQSQNGITEPDSKRLKNYLMPIIDGANILNSDGETTTATNLLTVSPYEYVMKDGKKEITFRNFSLWRFGQTKNLAHSEEFEGNTFNDANDYRGFFRTIKDTYSSGYAYLHLSASEYTKPDGAECIVIKDNDYTVEYDGSSYVDFSTITNPKDNPNELWKYAKWNNIPKGWGVRDNIRNASTGAGSVLYLGEFEDEADGIMNVVAPTTEDNAYYTLQGVKVSHPTKGIYIHNGKKVIIK